MQLETSTSVQLPIRDSLSEQIGDTLRARFEQYEIDITSNEGLLQFCVQVAISVMTGASSDPVWGVLKDPRKAPPLKRIISAIFGPFHQGKKEIYPSYFSVDEWAIYFRRAGRDAPRRITEVFH